MRWTSASHFPVPGMEASSPPQRGGCEEERARALSQHTRPCFRSVPGGVCVLSGQGLALLASIPLNRLVTVHARNFTSSLQLAPGGTGYVPRDWAYQQAGHTVEKKGSVWRNTLQPYKHGFHRPNRKNIRCHVSLATAHP